tara:strand:+ start:282 stop:482 length:201 start_codon:yes stop_codon:yes gene_type:complete
MLEFILFGLGFLLIIEGLSFFLLSHKIKQIFRMLLFFNPQKIRYFSAILMLVGLSFIYLTFKISKI